MTPDFLKGTCGYNDLCPCHYPDYNSSLDNFVTARKKHGLNEIKLKAAKIAVPEPFQVQAL